MGFEKRTGRSGLHFHGTSLTAECRTIIGGEERSRRRLLQSSEVTEDGTTDQGSLGEHGQKWSVHGYIWKAGPMRFVD